MLNKARPLSRVTAVSTTAISFVFRPSTRFLLPIVSASSCVRLTRENSKFFGNYVHFDLRSSRFTRQRKEGVNMKSPGASSFCFCNSFVPNTAVRRGSQRSPMSKLLRTPAKRTRHAVVMEEVDGGRMPEFAGDAQEVRYFSDSDAKSASELPDSSLTELPLFPLQLVLNPGTNIPLHIFEMRYRLLFNTIRDSDSRFGIVLYDGSTNSLAEVGCSAELLRFDPLPDGRIMTNNIGRQRFRIVRIIEEKPYTRAMVEFLNDNTPEEDFTPLVKEVWQALQDVLRLSNKLYDKVLDLSPDIKRLAPAGADAEEIDGDKISAQRLEDFSFAVCQVLDMPLKEQQILLQIQDTGTRLRRQNKMLQTARQYLAAQVTIKEAGLKGF